MPERDIEKEAKPIPSPSAEQTPSEESAPSTEPTPSEESAANPKPKRKLHIGIKILIGVVIGIIVIVAIAVIVFITSMRSTYAQFYDDAVSEFEIPGLSEGFIPQDMDYVTDSDTWLFSGYMGDDSASPIYRMTSDGNVSRIYINRPDGTGYEGHGGGIATDLQHVLLTDGSGYLVMDLQNVLESEAGEFVNADAYVPIEFTPAFLDIFGGTLYAGNFYDSENYDSPEKMHINVLGGGQNCAVMYAFPEDETSPSGWSLIPEVVYSIPDKVQGVCATATGNFVFSTSWGLNPSHLLVYKAPRLEIGTYEYSIVSLMPDGEDAGKFGETPPNQVEDANEQNAEEPPSDFVEVPLYVFSPSELRKDIEAIPMSEGIQLHEGRVFICNESASNKYFFGKLIGGQSCYSLDVMQYPDVDNQAESDEE